MTGFSTKVSKHRKKLPNCVLLASFTPTCSQSVPCGASGSELDSGCEIRAEPLRGGDHTTIFKQVQSRDYLSTIFGSYPSSLSIYLPSIQYTDSTDHH